MPRYAGLSALAIRGAALLPPRVRRFLRHNPLAWRALQRLLPAVLSDDASMVVRVRKGPLAGTLLTAGPGLPRYYWLGEHDEPAVVETLQRFARPGMIAIDVGANVGTETLLLADAVSPSGNVISVEPDPENAATLRANCSLNQIQNVRVLEKAASNHTGHLAFAATGQLTSHVSPNTGEASSIRVPCMRLDDLAREIADADLGLIKIDVEGHEVAVLEGCHELLSRRKPPVLLVEVHTSEASRGCVRLLSAHNYHLSVVGTNKHLEDLLSGRPLVDAVFVRGHLLGIPNSVSS